MKGKFEVVTLSGKKYPIAFNKFALGMLCRSEGITLDDLSSSKIKLDMLFLLKLAYYGLVGGAAAKGEGFPQSFVEMQPAFDDQEGWNKIIEIWNDSQAVLVGEEDKTGKSSKEGNV